MSRIIRSLLNIESSNLHRDIHMGACYKHTGYDDTSCFRSAVIGVQNTANAASDGYWSNFSGAAFCLAQPIGGLLVRGHTVKMSNSLIMSRKLHIRKLVEWLTINYDINVRQHRHINAICSRHEVDDVISGRNVTTADVRADNDALSTN